MEYGCAEWLKFILFKVRFLGADDRECEVAVYMDIAVAWKVFDCGNEASLLEPFNVGPCHAACSFRVVAEGAGVDDRV